MRLYKSFIQHPLIESYYHHILEFIRFGLVGCSSLLTYVLFSILSHYAGCSPLLAVTIASFLSISVSYFGHIHFTYRVEPEHGRMSWKFVILTVINFAIAQVMTYLLHTHFFIPFWMTSILVGLSIPLVSWPVGKFWVFVPQ